MPPLASLSGRNQYAPKTADTFSPVSRGGSSVLAEGTDIGVDLCPAPAYKQAIAVMNLGFISLAARERDSNAHCGEPAIHDEHEHKQQSFCDCH